MKYIIESFKNFSNKESVNENAKNIKGIESSYKAMLKAFEQLTSTTSDLRGELDDYKYSSTNDNDSRMKAEEIHSSISDGFQYTLIGSLTNSLDRIKGDLESLIKGAKKISK